jgi:hypothetical protein
MTGVIKRLCKDGERLREDAEIKIKIGKERTMQCSVGVMALETGK